MVSLSCGQTVLVGVRVVFRVHLVVWCEIIPPEPRVMSRVARTLQSSVDSCDEQTGADAEEFMKVLQTAGGGGPSTNR